MQTTAWYEHVLKPWTISCTPRSGRDQGFWWALEDVVVDFWWEPVASMTLNVRAYLKLTKLVTTSTRVLA